MTSQLVSPHWLEKHLTKDNLIVLDCRKAKPGTTPPRPLEEEYRDAHIPGAVYFDIDKLSDQNTPLPHMLAEDAWFAREVGKLGLRNDMTIIAYDEGDLFSAPRIWWMLRHYGATDVRVLDGGINAWRAEGRPLEQGEVSRAPQTFRARFDRQQVVSLAQVQAISEQGTAQIIDARAAGRFRGEVPEPRAGLHSGHIPNSLNVPFTLISADGKLKSPEALKQTFVDQGVDLEQPIVASCGSGVTAAALVFALETLGVEAKLYDGAWTEWGDLNGSQPVAKG
ncbi:3-mercaptopyruvate sulfurtransferase [Nissabacter sp. SGAir0207]|uniref:3-mercaptopyruvate sulfurtransferase n=1 Tax=Nissabacter sp. SGAir0207 TaxID=2126321 RepID=UPI0010CCC4B0|nr:3-mercaptopyruvate sulfurtransferase [Nissabacter sp. SGAir0207]QCR36956.1 3-mercaptopyruvate sulfurtransferase [Nissabacter sp. SGAir0207]